ncbi:MAG: hypothetical protein JWO53_491, partial [Chlamydiia bacterium]|nr:hypothetical protein [Chlamydiia bacterium]
FERAAVLTAGITAFSVIFAPMTCGASLGAGSLALASGRIVSVSTTLTGACAATAMKVSSVALPTINAIGSMLANDPSGSVATVLEQKLEVCLDKLSRAGQVMDRGGLTKAGRALEKHGNRPDSVFPKAVGNIANKNLQGQSHLNEILYHANKEIIKIGDKGYKIYAPDGRGAYIESDGSFRGFIERSKDYGK